MQIERKGDTGIENGGKGRVKETYSRRRINTEEKAKVAAAVWGTDFFIFLMAIHVGNTSSRKITEVKQQSKKRQKNPCRPNSFPLGRFEE